MDAINAHYISLLCAGCFASLFFRGAIARLEPADLILDGVGLRSVGLRGGLRSRLLRPLALLPVEVPQRDRVALGVRRQHLRLGLGLGLGLGSG